jgi:succinylglutamate desuccinylase
MDNATHQRLTNVPAKFPRVLGRVRGKVAGPTVITVGGIHGNEPAGALAAQRVFARIAREAPALRGEFVAFAGNVRALEARERYIARDLNRNWSDASVAALGAGGAIGSRASEDTEQQELWWHIDAARRAARGAVYFLDLHTTSADGIPFGMIGASPTNREFALNFPLPVILGLIDKVNGALLEYMRTLGCITLGVEAGQNERASSVDNHEAVLWIALVSAGVLAEAAVPDLEHWRDTLALARRSLPRMMEVLHRHAICPEDRFQMEPGFANIQPIHAGQLLARDRHGEIRAKEQGMLFLPLYQALGDDGFFLGRQVGA